MSKIYQVTFPDMVKGANGKESQVHLFGSLTAIYEVFTPEQIGCAVKHLYYSEISIDKPFLGRKCTIEEKELYRKKSNRGAKKE